MDAEAAARAVIAGDDLGTPKRQDGSVEAIRVLRLTRRSALKARTQAANQLHAIIHTAPSPLREQLRSLRLPELIKRVRRFRCATPTTPIAAAGFALRNLADRWTALDAELRGLDEQLTQLVETVASPLLAVRGVGVDTAGALLVAAGDNPDRLSSEASFAALCGVSPVDASSGRQHRHRLNRGGNRQANRALWVIAIVRNGLRPFDPKLRPTPHPARPQQKGNPALPETLHRSPAVQTVAGSCRCTYWCLGYRLTTNRSVNTPHDADGRRQTRS